MSSESAQRSPKGPPRISLNGRLGRLVDDKWYCPCNVPARYQKVHKVGPNEGVHFWRCSNSSNQCAFFLWVEHEAQARAWLEVSQPHVSSQTPAFSQTPQNLPTSSKRKTVSNEAPDIDAEEDSRDSTLEGDQVSSRINADGPPRKGVRMSSPLTSTRHFPEGMESGEASLPTPSSRDHRPTSRHSLAELRLRQLRDTSPTPGRFTTTKSTNREENADLTTRVVNLIRADNLELRASTELQLQDEIDLELEISEDRVRRYKDKISTLYKRIKSLEKEVVPSTGSSN